MDEMIKTRQLSEFVSKLLSKVNEDTQWEYWLHKVFDRSFEDYQAECKNNNKQSLAMTDEQVDATIKKSKGILKGFQPK